MDIGNMFDAIKYIKEASFLIKAILPKLPRNSKKQEIIQTLNEAEKRLKLAEAKSAKELGYPLCKCTWPPQIMLATKKENHFKCPRCEKEIESVSMMAAVGKMKSAEQWNNH